MKRLSFLKRGLRPSCVYMCALGFLLFELSTIACFAGVIYEYRQEGSATVIGTLEIHSPPASTSSDWNTTDELDLITLFLDISVFGFGTNNVLSMGGDLGFFEISSLNGERLDGGGIGIISPTIIPADPSDPTIDPILELQFDVPQGEDFLGLATYYTFPSGEVAIGDLFIIGDWAAQGTAVIPEPGTLILLGVGLFGVRWMSYRKQRRSGDV